MSEATAQDADDAFAAHLIENLFATWIDQDLERRGGNLLRNDVVQAVVELPPSGGSPVVTINNEVSLHARAVARAPIESGDVVTTENVRSIDTFWPIDVHPDSGWLALAVIGGATYVAFDLRYNKQRTSELLHLAEQYLQVVETVYLRTLAPAVDNLLSAAELVVQAQMLAESQQTKAHHVRDKWLRRDEDLGNAPAGYTALLQRLRAQRAAARYGDGQLTLPAAEVLTLIKQVRDLITHAANRVGVTIRFDTDPSG